MDAGTRRRSSPLAHQGAALEVVVDVDRHECAFQRRMVAAASLDQLRFRGGRPEATTVENEQSPEQRITPRVPSADNALSHEDAVARRAPGSGAARANSRDAPRRFQAGCARWWSTCSDSGRPLKNSVEGVLEHPPRFVDQHEREAHQHGDGNREEVHLLSTMVSGKQQARSTRINVIGDEPVAWGHRRLLDALAAALDVEQVPQATRPWCAACSPSSSSRPLNCAATSVDLAERAGSGWRWTARAARRFSVSSSVAQAVSVGVLRGGPAAAAQQPLEGVHVGDVPLAPWRCLRSSESRNVLHTHWLPQCRDVLMRRPHSLRPSHHRS